MREVMVIVRDRGSSASPKAIQCPKNVYNLLSRRAHRLDREHFWVIHLDARGVMLSMETCSIGTASASLVHPREAMKSGILVGACGLILCHNHPSGDSTPSLDDIETTKRLVKAGAIVGLPILDHVVIGRDSYVSIKERRPEIFDTRGYS
jgi:DNA repair protein RadC